jgi:hypothetical protein
MIGGDDRDFIIRILGPWGDLAVRESLERALERYHMEMQRLELPSAITPQTPPTERDSRLRTALATMWTRWLTGDEFMDIAASDGQSWRIRTTAVTAVAVGSVTVQRPGG